MVKEYDYDTIHCNKSHSKHMYLLMVSFAAVPLKVTGLRIPKIQ